MTKEDLTGSTIAGKYLVKRLIGEGGMGSVYEGEHVEIGKRVAIKVIHPSHAASEEVAERFRREARAASRVESEGIVQVFDVGSDPQAGLYMVMEFLSGEDLSERLKRDGRLDVPLAVSLALQTARALAKAHAAGVIHRDLKPANLFLSQREDGSIQVKILDFGISKLTANARTAAVSTTSRALTRSGTVIGTPQYMSPEQAQGLAIDLRTDVWSLGSVLYEALAGKSPFREMDTYEQTIIQIVTRRPDRLDDIAPWVPAELARLVHQALTSELGARIEDCSVFANRLAQLGPASSASLDGTRGQEAATTTPATPSKPRPTVEGVAVASSAKRGPAWTPRAAVALLVAGVAFAAVMGRKATHHVNAPVRGLVQSVHSIPTARTATTTWSVTTASASSPSTTPVVESQPSIGPATMTASGPSVASPGPSAKTTAPTKAKPSNPRPSTPSSGQIGGLGTTTEY